MARPYTTVIELADRHHEGMHPSSHLVREVQTMYNSARLRGLDLSDESRAALEYLGISEQE